MMKNKLHFIPLIAVPIIGLILASFFDLQIAQGIYFKDNGFGIVMSAFGELPIYLAISAIGGSFFCLGLKQNKIVFKILLIALGVIAYGISCYFQGEHIISRNAFNVESWWYLGYPIAMILCGVGFILGVFLTKKSDNPNLLKTLVILCFAILIPVLITFILKDIMLRPRFRFLIGDIPGQSNNLLNDFCSWWERGNEVESYWINVNEEFKEEFASFPSGHTNSTACCVIFLSYLGQFNSKFKKYQVPLFYVGFLWTIIMGFSRMTVGAHFLSDVCMGMLISFLVFLCIDFIFYKNKKENVVTKEASTND